MKSKILFLVPVTVKEFKRNKEGFGFYYSKTTEHIESLTKQLPECVLIKQWLDLRSNIYLHEHYLLAKEIKLSKLFRLSHFPVNKSYKKFNIFKKLLIQKEPAYNFEHPEIIQFLNELEQLYVKYPLGFIQTVKS